MKGHCNGCGNCCEAITVGLSKPMMRHIKHTDVPFLLKHWHRISGAKGSTIFSCDQFNTETRECMAHDERPGVCSGYPWYGAEPYAAKLAAEGLTRAPCGYWFDIPKKERPAWATPVSINKKR